MHLVSEVVAAVGDFAAAAVVVDFEAAVVAVGDFAVEAACPGPAVAMEAECHAPVVECRVPVAVCLALAVGCHVLVVGYHAPVVECHDLAEERHGRAAGCQVDPGHRSAVPPHSVALAAVARAPVLAWEDVHRCNPEEVVLISRRGRGPRLGLQLELVQDRESGPEPVLGLARARALEAGVRGSRSYQPGCRA